MTLSEFTKDWRQVLSADWLESHSIDEDMLVRLVESFLFRIHELSRSGDVRVSIKDMGVFVSVSGGRVLYRESPKMSGFRSSIEVTVEPDN